MTATIGRAREIAGMAALLRQEEIRLVTLTGPGGVGKTRLSLEVARTLQEDFADGVFFTSLAPLREQGQVLLALSQTLGIEENSSPELEKHLHEYTGNKHCLLLLDNFEHLPSDTGLVAALLADTTRLKILVSSREILHVYGEHEIVVSPLALPERKGAEIVSENAAMALFIERAQAVKATLSLDEEQRRAIGEICVQLDGLPLAIELTAARCKLLTPQAVLMRLHHRLSLLTGGARDLPARQQTLRNILDWSYDLLNSSEQRFFRQFGVFVGTWTFEAVAAVAREETLNALAMLTSLALSELLGK